MLNLYHPLQAMQLWTRGTLSYQLFKSKLSIAHEVQYRRQSASFIAIDFNYPLLVSYRNWITYQPHPSWQIAMSPIAIFHHNTLAPKQTLDQIKPNNATEWRAALAIQYTYPFVNNWTAHTRAGLEHRNYASYTTTRLRWRFGTNYKISPKFKIQTTKEILWDKGNIITSIWQYRWQTLLTWQVNKHLQMEIGYLSIGNKKTTTSNALQLQWQLNL